ncbi:hypothetical protein [Paraclostridium sordellii]|uniref:hypothetical protein n=1 Tax=Paraclostridium sordellii TaxID=1505 RepID=UPI001F056A45|nr:hypothetical protein [Paeniclostridium sordellii]MCH1967213.1 hypothetical protein [Paeniclostridium sordellii]
MKRSIIICLSIIGIVSTSSIVFANDIKVLNKNNFGYIPVKKVIQKSGGKVDISDNTAKITIDGNYIVIDKKSSFVKFNENYYPLIKKKINGIEVPVNIKPIFEKGEVYIEKNFLKDYKFVNYKIDKDNIKVILNYENKTEQNLEKYKKEEVKKEEVKKEEKSTLTTEKINYDSKKLYEESEKKSAKKAQRPSNQIKSEKTPVVIKPDTNIVGNTDNILENDIEKSTGDTKPEDIKKENQQNDVPKVEVPNDQSQGQVE